MSGVPPWWGQVGIGTMPNAGQIKPAVGWFEYGYLSNQLITPRILACPADRAARSASNWLSYVMSGRGNATSYTLGFHAMGDTPLSVLSTDLNLQFDGLSSTSCEARVVGARAILRDTNSSALAWTNGASHGDSGHVLLTDGSVEFGGTDRLRQMVLRPEADGISTSVSHFSGAR